MDLQLAGKHFYISGVSEGMGRSIAEFLVAEGAFVHGCARSRSALGVLRESLAESVRAVAHLDALDVLDADALKASVEGVGSAVGRLDGIVACAGVGVSGRVLDTLNEGWRQQFDIKVVGVLNLVRPALPWLRRARDPRIVIINGVTAHHPDLSMAAVSASRAATASLGRSLAEELAGEVTVNTVNVGAINTSRQTARWESSRSGISFEAWEARESARRGILVGRFGRPQEVAALVTFLVSPLAGYLSGSSIDVAGGSHGRP